MEENKYIDYKLYEKCLYSLNKYAKNCRLELSYKKQLDKEIEYRDYYNKKEFLLSLITPVCIHITPVKVEEYIKENDYIYFDKKFQREERKGRLLKYGKNKNEERWFKFLKTIPNKFNYFLFYKTDNYSFHTPIKESELSKYKDLEIVNIDNIITFEDSSEKLLTINEINDIINKIKYEDYIIQKEL